MEVLHEAFSSSFRHDPTFELHFPPLPRTAMTVATIASDASVEADTSSLAEIVHADPIVAALVLRRINSGYYGLARRISDIQQAVFLLGFDEVIDLVLMASLFRLEEIVRGERQASIFQYLMRQSIGTAKFAHDLAGFLHFPAPSQAFTVGLLHAIGRLVLLYNRPDDYEALWYTRDGACAPPAQAERTRFGTDHRMLAALAVGHWQLPRSIGNVISAYDEPQHLQNEEERRLSAMLAVAAHATTRLYDGRPEADAPAGAASHAGRCASLLQSFPGLEEHTPARIAAWVEDRSEAVRAYTDEMMQR